MNNRFKSLTFAMVITVFSVAAVSLSAAEKVKPSIAIQPVPFMISPNGDGDLDSTVINLKTAGIKKVKAWALKINNDKGVMVREMSWPDAMPGIIKWDGKDAQAKAVPDGKYTAVLSAQLKKHFILVSTAPVLVDCSPPAAVISASPSVFSPNGDGKDDTVSFKSTVKEFTYVERWQIEIRDENGTLVNTLKGRGNPPAATVWNGKDSYYKKVAPSGIYSARMILWDALRNRGESSSVKVRLFIPPKVITKQIKVKQEKRGLKVNLSSNILFGSGKNRLQKSSHKALNEVVKLIKAYPENKVAIEGYTDSVGSAAYNKKLSLKRAQAIYRYLVSKGLPKARFIVKGFGEIKPIATNRNRAGRMKNRRVEITILKKGSK